MACFTASSSRTNIDTPARTGRRLTWAASRTWRCASRACIRNVEGESLRSFSQQNEHTRDEREDRHHLWHFRETQSRGDHDQARQNEPHAQKQHADILGKLHWEIPGFECQ